MNKKLLLAGLAGILSLATACKKDDPSPKPTPTPQPGFTIEAKTTDLLQFDTVRLSAQGTKADAKFSWVINGKEVGEGKDYAFTQPRVGRYQVSLVDKTSGEKVSKDFSVTARFTSGAFLLNEGNFGNETGTLTYIDASKQFVLDSAYIRVNGTKLGNVCQDMTFANGKVYIISQNGPKNGGEGLLTIADAKTLEKHKVINDATLAKDWPTHIAVVHSRIYLRGNSGIYRGTEEGSFKLIPGTEQANKLRMVTIGELVIATTSTNKLLVIQDEEVKQTFTLPEGSPSGLALAPDGQLWLSYSKPNTLAKVSVSASGVKILDKHTTTQSLDKQWTATSAIFARANQIFFTEQSSVIYRHDFSTGETKEIVDVQKVDKQAKMYYNSLGIDPKTGHIYYASFGDYSTYKKNVTLVLDHDGKVLLKREHVNAFPAGFYFIP
ncbi:DUF5074 domain-containing protein [uncultured Porphyromonas sp.]|uniref:DUF5074 domain-containing protein n=1 Tax=uncultured Porphyromonas sp. TaxID=159274 RepID=UPI00261F8975|nr:DUF5074 domain-containing protein [uncultured Porphyromonas sp.]